MPRCRIAVLCSLVVIMFCQCSTTDTTDYYGIALTSFISNETSYFPVEKLNYLDNIYSNKVSSGYGVNVDSIIEWWSTVDQYNQRVISDEKKRQIYRELLATYTSENDLNINIVENGNPLSNWAENTINSTYRLNEFSVVVDKFNSKSLVGLPFNIRYTNVAEVHKNDEANKCKKFIKLSAVNQSKCYFFVEIVYGCGTTGEQKQLLVLTEFYGKVYVENVFRTDYKY